MAFNIRRNFFRSINTTDSVLTIYQEETMYGRFILKNNIEGSTEPETTIWALWFEKDNSKKTAKALR
jgi:hypothetical protein